MHHATRTYNPDNQALRTGASALLSNPLLHSESEKSAWAT